MEDNYTFIAQNTTKYYLELQQHYQERYRTSTSLLATAGVLDAQNYIFIEKNFDISDLLHMAEDASPHEENALVEFITLLEIEIFKVDNPTIAPADIVMACIGKKADIENAVQKTKEQYLGDTLFSSVVSAFMNLPQFKAHRKKLGIKD
jgi:hypothetical protein